MCDLDIPREKMVKLYANSGYIDRVRKEAEPNIVLAH